MMQLHSSTAAAANERCCSFPAADDLLPRSPHACGRIPAHWGTINNEVYPASSAPQVF